MSAASKMTAAVTMVASSVALTSPAFAASADAGLGSHADLVHGIQYSGTAAATIVGVGLTIRLVSRYRRSVWRRNWVLRQCGPVSFDRTTAPTWSAPSVLMPGQRPMSSAVHRSATTL